MRDPTTGITTNKKRESHRHHKSSQVIITSRTLRRPPVYPGWRAQKKFLDLGGSAENQGDLKSVVLHKMTLAAQKSTFPVGMLKTPLTTHGISS